MKIEYKSMFSGIILGILASFVILILVGNVETKFSFSTGDNPEDLNKNINVSIERTVKNKKDYTDIIVKASGAVTKEDIDIELERLFNELEIDKETSDINIDIRINS
tara:strand:+ start:1245 stop:1565 length:321 start_codon:yes stop_codon:yes gene_type:complete